MYNIILKSLLYHCYLILPYEIKFLYGINIILYPTI